MRHQKSTIIKVLAFFFGGTGQNRTDAITVLQTIAFPLSNRATIIVYYIQVLRIWQPLCGNILVKAAGRGYNEAWLKLLTGKV